MSADTELEVSSVMLLSYEWYIASYNEESRRKIATTAASFRR
jgi:hypothetical protein